MSDLWIRSGGEPGHGGHERSGASGPPLSGLAVSSLVFAVLWLCGLGSLLAIFLGIVALLVLWRRPGRGTNLALWGIALGVGGLVLTTWLTANLDLDDHRGEIAPPTAEECAKAEADARLLDSTLYGIDVTTGRELWRRDVGWTTNRPTAYRGRVLSVTEDLVSGDAVLESFDGGSGALVWRRSLGAWDGVEAPTVFADGVIGVNATPGPNTLLVDAETGALLRRLDAWQPVGMNGLPDPVNPGTPVGPLERRGGMVVDREALRRVDPRTGVALWSTNPPGDGYTAVDSRNPIAVGSVVAAQEHATEASRVFGFDREGGALLWEWEGSMIELHEYFQGEANATVVPIPSYAEGLVALDPRSGRKLWRAPMRTGSQVLFMDDGALVMRREADLGGEPAADRGTTGAHRDEIVSVDPLDGHVRWVTGRGEHAGTFMQHVQGTIAATTGSYDDYGLAGFDAATGARRWTLPADRFRGATLWRSDDGFLVATADGRVFAIAPQDGTIRWQTAATQTITSQIEVADGRAFYYSRPTDERWIGSTLESCRSAR